MLHWTEKPAGIAKQRSAMEGEHPHGSAMSYAFSMLSMPLASTWISGSPQRDGTKRLTVGHRQLFSSGSSCFSRSNCSTWNIFGCSGIQSYILWWNKDKNTQNSMILWFIHESGLAFPWESVSTMPRIPTLQFYRLLFPGWVCSTQSRISYHTGMLDTVLATLLPIQLPANALGETEHPCGEQDGDPGF